MLTAAVGAGKATQLPPAFSRRQDDGNHRAAQDVDRFDVTIKPLASSAILTNNLSVPSPRSLSHHGGIARFT